MARGLEESGTMRPEMPFRLTICGLDELQRHGAARVTHVLSILDPGWPEPPAFAAYAPHRRLELRFDDVIDALPGTHPPQRQDVERLLAFGRELAGTSPAHLLVHCHAGISRSTAAAALILAAAAPALGADGVFAAVLGVRARAWPNLRMIEFGDASMDRGGTLVAAAAELYRRALAREPALAERMIYGGRGREVAAAGGG
jgi:predicted protein tyrosine phosphatase